MFLANHVWNKHVDEELPEAVDEGAAGYVDEVREYFSARASSTSEITKGQQNWYRTLGSTWSEHKDGHNIDDSTPVSELTGGRIRATKFMSGLLAASNGLYTWENYGHFWDNDHWPIPYASIVPGDTSTYFRVLHFSNYRPLEHHPNIVQGCKR